MEARIPSEALIVLVPDYDKELADTNKKMAEASRETGQPVVYVMVNKMRASRIEELTLQVA